MSSDVHKDETAVTDSEEAIRLHEIDEREGYRFLMVLDRMNDDMFLVRAIEWPGAQELGSAWIDRRCVVADMSDEGFDCILNQWHSKRKGRRLSLASSDTELYRALDCLYHERQSRVPWQNRQWRFLRAIDTVARDDSNGEIYAFLLTRDKSDIGAHHLVSDRDRE